MPLTPILPTSSAEALISAHKWLTQNGIIVVPTDTVYGITCSAFKSQPIKNIFSIKGRDANKALPILIGNIGQLELVALQIQQKARMLIDAFWPGALTIIVTCNPSIPKILSPYSSVGVRMPNHPWLLELLCEIGPLATTSANASGKPESRNVKEVVDALDGKVDLIVDGGQSGSALPSTVVDCQSDEIKILREGPIKSSEIFDLLL
jgi:L-threonylcarbamoyladenylate synthase